MKKLLMITLSLLLFTFLISPIQAKRLGPLDRPLPDYNNLTLRQIFEDGNLTSLASFNSPEFATVTQYSNYFNVSELNAVTYYSNRHMNFNLLQNNLYYSLCSVSSNDNISVQFGIRYAVSVNTPYTFNNLINNVIQTKSAITSGGANNGYLRFLSYNLGTNFNVHGVYIINLNTLGIPTATKIEMDNLYLDYVKYKNMMNATDVMLIVGQLVAFVWSLVVSFEIFGFVLWEYAIFGIGAGFIGYLALKIIQKKAGDDNGDSD